MHNIIKESYAYSSHSTMHAHNRMHTEAIGTMYFDQIRANTAKYAYLPYAPEDFHIGSLEQS